MKQAQNHHPHLTLIPPLIIAVMIFLFSSFGADASDSQSGFIVNLVTSIAPRLTNLDLVTTIVRKTAHFTEYTLLGFFTARAFATYKKSPFWAISAGVAYAISDELHQLLVPGRSCEITDVFIDSAGVAIGTTIYFLVLRQKLSKLTKR